MSSTSPLLTSITVQAGAGAGKTTNLTGTVLDLAEKFFAEHKRWPRIVVSTFTRKATQELKERLLVRALKEKPHLVDFVQNKSDLVVGTLHGIMDRFLKAHAKSFGLPPNYEIVSASTLKQMEGSVLRALSESNAYATQLISAFGFYKTLDLLAEYRSILTLNPHAAPIRSEDIMETFSKDIKQKLIHLHELARLGLTFNAREPIHNYFEWMVKGSEKVLSETDLIGALDLDQDFSQSVTEEIESFVPHALSFLQHKISVRGMKTDDETMLDIFKQLKECVADLLTMKWYRYSPTHIRYSCEMAQALEQLAIVFEEQMRIKKADKGYVGLSEVELLTLRMAEANPALTTQYAREFDYWMIDEFQDTSPLQVQILRHLIADRPTYIVGDPQQSIYLFRGARSQLFTDEIHRLKGLGAESRLLNKNYRSKASLMKFINQMISQLPGGFVKMETRDSEYDESPVATVCVLEDSENEKKFISERIMTLLERGVRADQIAVLVRSHSQAREIAQDFSARHIPHQLHAGGQFANRYEVQDGFTFLKFLAQPHDDQNLVQLVRSPWLRIEDETLAKWCSLQHRDLSLWEVLAKQSHSVVDKLKQALEQQSAVGYYEVFRQYIMRDGLWKSHLIYDGSGQREGNLFLLLARLHEETRKPQFNLLEFIRSQLERLAVEEGESEGKGTFATDRVHVMTIHASKGLEFDYVFLPDLSARLNQTTFLDLGLDEKRGTWFLRVPLGAEEKSTPTPAEGWALEQIQEAEFAESYRLLYVAMTRAKSHLFLSWSGKVSSGSWAQYLPLDLQVGIHNGDHFKYEVVEFREPEAKIKRISSDALLKDAALSSWSGAPSQRATQSQSVTALLESEALPHRILTRMAEKAAAGTKVHRLFELLKYPSQTKLHALIQRWFPEQESEVLAGVEFVRDSKNPALLEIIQNGKVEWGFATRVEGRRLEGQIDLYGRDHDGKMWIVDYKSGTSDLVEKAFLQLEIYSLALKTIWPALKYEAIGLAVVYPFEQKIEQRESSTYDQSLAQFLDLFIVKE